MTIQLSVTVWTIICFVLLMLILHNLLFKPILKVMDDRRARIKNAADKKAEYERRESEHAAKLREQEAALLSAHKKQVKDEIEALRADSRKAVEAAKDERLRKADDFRIKIEEERDAILDDLSARKTELATVFARSVTKG